MTPFSKRWSLHQTQYGSITSETYGVSGDGIRLSAATGPQPAKTVRFSVDRTLGQPYVASERDGAGKTLRRYPLRRRLFGLAGRRTRSARRQTLHFPARWPWAAEFRAALARLRAIPLLA